MSQPELGASNSSTGNYLSLIQGKWRKKVKETTPGAEKRKNTQGKWVWELTYNQFAGYLKSIKTVDGDYGKQLCLEFEAGGEVVNIYLSLFKSGATRRILMCLLNPELNLSGAIKLSPWKKDEEARTIIYVFQWKEEKTESGSNWHNVDPAFEWDDNAKKYKGLPSAQQVPDGEGGTKFDYSAQVKKLLGMIAKDVSPNLKGEPNSSRANLMEEFEAEPMANEIEPLEEEETDDLPF